MRRAPRLRGPTTTPPDTRPPPSLTRRLGTAAILIFSLPLLLTLALALTNPLTSLASISADVLRLWSALAEPLRM